MRRVYLGGEGREGCMWSLDCFRKGNQKMRGDCGKQGTCPHHVCVCVHEARDKLLSPMFLCFT